MDTQTEALNRIALPNIIPVQGKARLNQAQSAGPEKDAAGDTTGTIGNARAPPSGAAEWAKELHFLFSLTKESTALGSDLQ